MKHRIWVRVLGGVCVLSFGSTASAQSLERLSLGVETGIFSVQSETHTFAVDGITVDVDQTTSGFGLGGLGFGLNLAGGVAENVVLGVEALVANANTEVGSSKTDVLQLILQPRVEYVFGSDAFRPFIAGVLGYRSSSMSSGNTEADSSLFSFGAAIGAHAFIGDSFSIDPMLSFQGLAGTRTETIEGMEFEGNSGGTLIALTVAFSGWFGASPAKASDGETWSAPQTGAGAAAPVPAYPQAEEKIDEVKVTVELPDQHRLVLFARPAVAKAVKVTMIESSNSSWLRECRELELVAADKKFPLQRVVLPGARTLRMQLHYLAEGVTKPEALASMAAAPEASIRVCDRAWKVSAESQATIRTFLEKYRELGGVIEGPPAEPSVASPVPATDAQGNPTAPAAAEPALTAPPAQPAPPVQPAPPTPPVDPAKAPTPPTKSPAPAKPSK